MICSGWKDLLISNRFKSLGDSKRWTVLVDGALRGAKAHGLCLSRKPGRGKSNVWIWQRPDGESELVSIRTSQSRAFAFPPLDGGAGWKTLDDVAHVLVATVDDPADPAFVDVYLFGAAEVRERFDANYHARISAGQVVPDDYGSWIALDPDMRDTPASVGSGLALLRPPIASYPLDELMPHAQGRDDYNAMLHEEKPAAGTAAPAAAVPIPAVANRQLTRVDRGPESVGDTITWARRHIADLAGVPIESIRLELKIEGL